MQLLQSFYDLKNTKIEYRDCKEKKHKDTIALICEFEMHIFIYFTLKQNHKKCECFFLFEMTKKCFQLDLLYFQFQTFLLD